MTYSLRESPSRRPVFWVASTRQDLRDFPEAVKDKFGYALYLAQIGSRHSSAEPLRGFGGATTLAVRADYRGSTFRVVYTVAFPLAVYVLHVFKKKSRKNVKTPKNDRERIRARMSLAESHYAEWVSWYAP